MLREDPVTGFLAFSVPDAVVHALSGLQSLVVRSSAVASRYGRDSLDLTQIAAEGDVDAVVTGTLLRSGEQIRMSAQLLTVPGGTVLWSQSLQVPLREIFELQDRLVMHIVGSLPVSLTAREQRRLQSDVPNNPAAYEFFLRGNESIVATKHFQLFESAGGAGALRAGRRRGSTFRTRVGPSRAVSVSDRQSRPDRRGR